MELGMFTTRIRTGMGEEITLPNSGVMAASIKNYSRAVPGTGLRRRHRGDHRLRRRRGARCRRCCWRRRAAPPTSCASPRRIVRQTALSDFYVEYRLAAYTPVRTPAAAACRRAAAGCTRNIQDVFNEYGVQIMSPHYMVDPRGAAGRAEEGLVRRAGAATGR